MSFHKNLTIDTRNDKSLTDSKINLFASLKQGAAKRLEEQSSQWKLNVLLFISSSPSPMQSKTKQANELFAEFVTKRHSKNSSSDEKNNKKYYPVWETTCHIMRELAGYEKNSIFDFNNPLKDAIDIDALALLSIQKAIHELKITNITGDNAFVIGGTAIWNLLLPVSKGGCFPDKTYDAYIKHITSKIQPYIPFSVLKFQVNESDVTKAFLEFKKFSLEFQKQIIESAKSAAPSPTLPTLTPKK